MNELEERKKLKGGNERRIMKLRLKPIALEIDLQHLSALSCCFLLIYAFFPLSRCFSASYFCYLHNYLLLFHSLSMTVNKRHWRRSTHNFLRSRTFTVFFFAFFALISQANIFPQHFHFALLFRLLLLFNE
jgi:hypothetical protein